MTSAYGANTNQVEMLLSTLRDLSAMEWRSLEDAHETSATLDPAEEALAGVLTAQDLREGWFELRAEATTLAKVAAVEYAEESDEEERTIEHVAAVNAWDGQHEKSKLEVLGPAHERGFIDAACGALGVLLSRPYIGEREFERFWAPYVMVLGAVTADR